MCTRTVNSPRIRAITSSTAPPIWSRAIVENYLEMARRTTVRDLHVNRWTRWIASSYPPLPSSAFFYLFSPFGALHQSVITCEWEGRGEKRIYLFNVERIFSRSRDYSARVITRVICGAWRIPSRGRSMRAYNGPAEFRWRYRNLGRVLGSGSRNKCLTSIHRRIHITILNPVCKWSR